MVCNLGDLNSIGRAYKEGTAACCRSVICPVGLGTLLGELPWEEMTGSLRSGVVFDGVWGEFRSWGSDHLGSLSCYITFHRSKAEATGLVWARSNVSISKVLN